MAMDQKKTGALIAAVRRERGMTQKELARRLHVSDRTVSKGERGAGFPDVGTLIPLADALGLTVPELLRGERDAAVTPDAAARETAVWARHSRRAKRRRAVRAAVTGLVCTLALWCALGLPGLLSLPVDWTAEATVYRADGSYAGNTLIRWEGRLFTRLPWWWEFRGHIQTPLDPVSVDGRYDVQDTVPLLPSGVTFSTSKTWTGNISSPGPFIESGYILDWWGKQCAFRLTDGTVAATSAEAYRRFLEEFGP